MAVSEELRRQVRAKLRVTWSDDVTDSLLDEVVIPNAMAAIRSKVGIPDSVEHDFAEPGGENILLLAHCYYQWNDAEDDFDAHYAAEIAQARAMWEVRQLAGGKEADADL